MGLEAMKATPAMALQWGPLSGSGDRLQYLRLHAHPTPPLRLSSRSTPLLTFARRRNRDAALTVSPRNSNNNNNNKVYTLKLSLSLSLSFDSKLKPQ